MSGLFSAGRNATMPCMTGGKNNKSAQLLSLSPAGPGRAGGIIQIPTDRSTQIAAHKVTRIAQAPERIPLEPFCAGKFSALIGWLSVTAVTFPVSVLLPSMYTVVDFHLAIPLPPVTGMHTAVPIAATKSGSDKTR